jgi:UDP-glucose 4-epimerase
VALRYFNIYGPRMDLHGAYTEVLPRWLDRIEAGQAPIIFGDGLQSVDMVYVEDVAEANLLAASSPLGDVVYNIASGRESTLIELCRLTLDLMGRADLAPRHEPERKLNPVRRRLASIERARQELGFEPRVDLKTGLERLIGWRRGAA